MSIPIVKCTSEQTRSVPVAVEAFLYVHGAEKTVFLYRQKKIFNRVSSREYSFVEIPVSEET